MSLNPNPYNSKSMREAFLECAKVQFAGTTDVLGRFQPLSPNQHRAAIRTFAMGWCEGIKLAYRGATLNACPEFMAYLRDLQPVIFDANWYPDESWRWW